MITSDPFVDVEDYLRCGLVPERLGEHDNAFEIFPGLRKSYERVASAYVLSEMPKALDHKSAIWLICRVAHLERVDVATEVHAGRGRIDLVVADPRGGEWLVEWKTKLKSPSQRDLAVKQLRGYAADCDPGARLIVAGYGALPQTVVSGPRPVEIMSPDGLLVALRDAGRANEAA